MLINGKKILPRHFSIEKIYRLYSKSVRNNFFDLRVKHEHKLKMIICSKFTHIFQKKIFVNFDKWGK